MGDGTIGRRSAAKAGLAALVTALLASVLAASVQAAAPAHPRTPALDVPGLDKACGAAVDKNGDVYASSAGEGKVKVFDAADHTTPIAQISNANEPCALAVSTKGELLVSERATGEVVSYTPDAFPLTATPVYSPRQVIDASGDAEGIAIDPFDDRLYVAEGGHVAVYRRSEVQSVATTGSGGSFKLRFEGAETAPIAFNATAAEVQAALEALATIEPGEVTVSGKYTISFQGSLAYTDVPQLEGVSSLTGSEKQKLTVKATAGTYKLSFEGEETAAIAFNASAIEVQAALEALGKLAPGDVAVSGGPGDAGGTSPYEVAFGGAYADANVNQLSADASGLAGGTASLSTTSEGAGMTILPSTNSGGLGIDEVQQLALKATAGTYKLSFEGEETAPIAFNASAATVQTALEALGKLAPGDVAVGASGFGGFQTLWVGFGGTYAATDVPQLGAVSTALSPSEIQRVTVKATTGTYTLTFEGEATAPIAFNASAAEVQAALEALGKLAPGDVAVSGGPGDAAGTSPYEVAFGGAYAGRDLEQMTSSSSGLAGGSASVTTRVQGAIAASTLTSGWSGHILEGQLAEATGVAAYTNPHVETISKLKLNLAVAEGAGDELQIYSGPTSATALKLRKTVTGVDHDENPGTAEQEFSFGAAGAYLAADRGNENTTTKKCVQVQVGGLDQACTQGHFFLHDAGNGAIDEFDATGEFFTQITSPGLQDAEPTQIAVERSGGANDGTLYAGSGSGAVASLLAFAPVLEPSRQQLPEPFSKVLTSARAVATDCEGFVYVAAQTKVHVYSPAGAEVTSFEVPSGSLTQDLAADCKGHVYVVNVAGTEMTYYTPSAYPPTGSTTYTRKTPALLTASGLQAVAVNPANEHAFVTGGSTFAPVIKEFAPPSESSTLAGECGAGLGLANARQDIDVYGKNGNVYLMAQLSVGILYVLKCGNEASEAELIREIREGGGCPSGKPGSVPRLAIDQSNGHFVEWANGQEGNSAREYDAFGACLAEFGTFSYSFGGNRVALDNSCALHDPPLTESTTPTCADTYPSNGTAYVAFDSTNNAAQPFDVNAFGPLEFPEVEEEEPEEFTLKVNKDGSGTGTVTSAPSGINCGSTCEADFEEGAEVTLTGSPGANSKAVVWGGCDSVNGENKCLVTMDEDTEVTATFDLEQHLLSVSKTGSGAGKVTSSPPGIDCGSDCEELYDHGTVVTLEADPDSGSEFTGFSGACTGTGSCEVTMTAAKSVTANFDEESVTPKFLLSVDVEGTGSGTVTSDKGLISCDPVCSDEYEEGTLVVLTATADPGSVFVSWKYCDKKEEVEPGVFTGVNGRQCTMKMDEAEVVKAVFTTTHALEVSRAGSGLGKVQSSPGGILCLSNCSETTASFKEGTKVTLKQTPAKHFHFVEWLGDCTGSGACELTMGEDHAVEAEFAEDPKHLLTLAKSGGGQGTVKSSIAGINCGLTCSEQASAYFQGEVVELTATPGKGSTFGGWSGAGCSGTGTCTVTISEAKAVQAEFE